MGERLGGFGGLPGALSLLPTDDSVPFLPPRTDLTLPLGVERLDALAHGTFPIWHRETQLQLMDLQTGEVNPLTEVNSDRSETYHSWSSNSRWFAFASKRGDGQYGRIYLAYVDAEGRVHRPFVLPQKDPEHDDLNLKSYNLPDLSQTPVTISSSQVEEMLTEPAEAMRWEE